VIDPRTRRAIELDALLERIAGGALSSLGGDALRALAPTDDAAEIARRQARVAEVLRLLEGNRRLPIDGLDDISDVLDHAAIQGAALSPDEWPALRNHLDVVGRLAEFVAEDGADFPAIARECATLAPNGPLAHAIARVFDEDGLVRDEASPELADVRRRLRAAEREVLKAVGRLVTDLKTRGILQEEFSTQRNGRHVVPVRAGSRGRVQGIVHGSSSSGETLYVEPLEIVEASNETELLREREAREIHRIMLELTAMLRPFVPEARGNLAVLATLDATLALARLCYERGWKLPVVSDAGALRILSAHHPMLHLLRPASSVPITCVLDAGDRVVVISGPNAGGKTTAMKTVALSAILAQCGAPIPSSPDTRTPLFRGFHADIGDSQDLDAGLSTFTGHIRRLGEIVDATDDHALVLLDELGTGTDPEEGGALARALLEDLAKRVRLAIATTHLSAVIAWGEDAPHVRNASFSLDDATHRPTYRLRLDMPGASEAIVIAENEGLPSWILSRARELVGAERLAMGEMLRRIQERDRVLGETLAEAEARAKSFDELERLARDRAEELRLERREMRRTAAEERAAAVREVRERLEKMIAELPSEEALEQRRRALNDVRRLAIAEQQRADAERREADKRAEAPDPGALKPGRRVFVPAFGNWGEVRRVSSDGRKVVVIVGSVEAELSASALGTREPERKSAFADPRERGAAAGPRARSRKVKDALADATIEPTFSEPSVKRPPVAAGVARIAAEYVPMEIDLHGFRVEEALAAIDKYLDRALMADYPYVRIVHGSGEGRLYRAVHEFLRTYKPVRKYRFANSDEGGAGVTIVEF